MQRVWLELNWGIGACCKESTIDSDSDDFNLLTRKHTNLMLWVHFNS